MSWLDPVGAQILSSRLNKRLVHRNRVARQNGEPGLFITLTYNRADWESAQELWDNAGSLRHVPRFMDRLRKLGVVERSAVWCCKKEFQQGGWLHYHLLVYGVRYLPPEVAADAWGHGFVSIKRVNRRRLDYTAKYNAKIGQYPEWLLDREVGSVRIFSVSHGFWQASEAQQAQSPSEGAPLPFGEGAGGLGGVRSRLPTVMQTQGCNDRLTFRDRIREARQIVSVHEEGGAWSVVPGLQSDVILGMCLLGFKCDGHKYGGMVYRADHEDVLLAMRAIHDWKARHRDLTAVAEFWAAEEGAGRGYAGASGGCSRASDGGAVALNLITNQNCAQSEPLQVGYLPF
jgi:hypothetical protein